MNCSITDFGAVSSRTCLSTEAFRRAVAACAASGGGYVEVPAGEYLTGTVCLEDHVYLRLAPGSTILGSEHYSDYIGPQRGCAWGGRAQALEKDNGLHTPEKSECRALILADRKTDCGIVGPGRIDGQRGDAFSASEEKGRPFLVVFSECRSVSLRDVTMVHTGFFTFYALNCEEVLVHGVTVRTADCPNGDGLDFDGGRRILISDCNIEAGDDAIGLKTLTPWEPVEDMTVTNCILSATTRCGAVRFGPESAGDMRRICFSNCIFHDSDDGFKLQLTENAVFEDFSFTNILMQNVRRPVFMTLNRYNMSSQIPKLRPEPGKFRRIRFSGITARTCEDFTFEDGNRVTAGSVMTGLPGFPIEEVSFTDCSFLTDGHGTREEAARAGGRPELYDFWSCYPEVLCEMGRHPSSAFYIRNAEGVRFTDCDFASDSPDARCALAAEDVSRMSLNRCSSRNNGGLLRYYRCPDLRVQGCEKEKLLPFSEEQKRDWEALRESSLHLDKLLEKVASDAEQAAEFPIALRTDGAVLSFQSSGRRQFLLVPDVRGSFTLELNGESVDSRLLPEEYSLAMPYAFELTGKLREGENNLRLIPGKDYSLNSMLQLRAER